MCQGLQKISFKVIFTFLILFLVANQGALAKSSYQTSNQSEPLIRLQFATFNPMQGEPDVPQHLKLAQETMGNVSSAYIVQFEGPVKEGWKKEVKTAGGQIDSYIPEYAFIVQMNGETKTKVEQFSFVRWIGIYHPAYKLSPSLKPNPINLYRVHLAQWSDLNQIQQQFTTLGVNYDVQNGTEQVVNTEFSNLEQIAQIPDVLWIEPFQFYEKQNDIAVDIINAPAGWSQGYTGSGQIVTVGDSGLDTGTDNPAIDDDIHRDFDNRVSEITSWPITASPGCISNAGANDGPADVESGHGTHVTGSAFGNGARSNDQYRGAAYEATITFQALEQSTIWEGFCSVLFGPQSYSYTGVPNDLNDLFQESYNWGARIHTNSWGASAEGEYTTSSQQADQFIWNHQDFTILFAAGNAGQDANFDGYVDTDSIGSPATAKNVITVGASENNRSSGGYNPGGPCSTYGTCFQGTFPTDPTNSDQLSDTPDELAAFSSRGPTDDGRIKPDLVAPGTNVLSTRSSVAAGNLWGAGPSPYYVYSGGTSMATPLVAGGATIVRDYLVNGEGYTNPSAALIKAILINSAVDIPGYGNVNQEAGQPIPNNHEGWGRVDLAGATSGNNRTLVDNQSLDTTVIHTFSLTRTNTSGPLKTSLVWSDYPGSPGAAIQLVNNLNLKVTAPNGATYVGNNFSNGWSTTGGSFDTLNNVENIYIQSAITGVWTIDVIGSNVPQGPQPYALVVSGEGDLSEPVVSNFELQFVYLPLITKSPPDIPVSNIPNGNFENGADGTWTEFSLNGFGLILPLQEFPAGITPRSGSWAAWLGGAADEISYIQQQVTVPAATPYLAYWRWIVSEDVCGYDFGGVLVNGTVVEVYDLCTTTDTGGWQMRTIDLNAYAGQSILLQIRAETDDSLNSNLFIDDVAFQAAATLTGSSLKTAVDEKTGSSELKPETIRRRSTGDAPQENFRLFLPQGTLPK